MKEIFLEYAKAGSMTKKELAGVLKMTTRWVSDRAREGKIPVVPMTRPYRFDPTRMIELFCEPQKVERPRSLTIERRISRGNPKGGFRKCL